MPQTTAQKGVAYFDPANHNIIIWIVEETPSGDTDDHQHDDTTHTTTTTTKTGTKTTTTETTVTLVDSTMKGLGKG